jgi:hypothetical protein
MQNSKLLPTSSVKMQVSTAITENSMEVLKILGLAV